jgi:hypothetical protein
VETVVWGFAVFQIVEREVTVRSERDFLVWSLEVDHLDIKSLQVNNGKNSRFWN